MPLGGQKRLEFLGAKLFERFDTPQQPSCLFARSFTLFMGLLQRLESGGIGILPPGGQFLLQHQGYIQVSRQFQQRGGNVLLRHRRNGVA
ncbi:hypothetical protein [Pseudomonas canadensis]|uniref:hypothetical protein n=1 Tax=Pseudomonas TaxID=286 RepID=UPI0028128BA6|nr:hypothetical protein [Pseudomonas canadensis]WNJ87873.1 hypothetical protein RMQ99_21680 [Pseudomonas canadensis]